MKIPKLEAKLGLEVYYTKTPGIGGLIRQIPEDFVVEEVLVNGSIAEVYPNFPEGLTGGGNYLLCILVKRNWDTFLAAKALARGFKISRKRISFAGIKDKRALTSQFITIRGVTPEKISGLSIKGLRLIPVAFSNRINADQLFGNNFRIVVRGVKGKPEQIRNQICDIWEELKSIGGVPNFYGHQRFGTIRPITHLVGRYLVLRNFKKAVFKFLTEPSRFERATATDARIRLMRSCNFKQALKEFPKGLKFELSMLNWLIKHPSDYTGALRRLPIGLRKLFVQAYQSFLFNRTLSERIKLGISLNEAQAGDYVVKLNEVGLKTNVFYKVSSNNRLKFNNAIKAKKFALAIPVIGYLHGTSGGQQGEIEERILEEEGISPRQFYIGAVPEISSPGLLRRLVAPIRHFVFPKIERDELNSNCFKITFSFQLLKGSYATVVMREFLKPIDVILAGF